MSTRKSTDKRDFIQWKLVGAANSRIEGFDASQVQFARRIGISQGFLSAIERGEKEIGAEVLLRISRESGKSLEWL